LLSISTTCSVSQQLAQYLNNLLNMVKKPLLTSTSGAPFLAHFYYSTLIKWSMMGSGQADESESLYFFFFLCFDDFFTFFDFFFSALQHVYLFSSCYHSHYSSSGDASSSCSSSDACSPTNSYYHPELHPQNVTSLLPAVPSIVPRLPTDIAGLTS